MSNENKRILIVEDNVHNRRIFSGVLKHHGYTVDEATTGEEALTYCADQKPDLILMDLSLPVMDGWTATEKIKASEDLRDIPVIALTAHAMTGDEERARKAGCDGYLSKPISPKQLAGEIDRVLTKTNG